MKKLLLLASVVASLFAFTQKAGAGGISGTSGGFYYFTYYTGSGTTSISGSGGNFAGSWTAGITDSLVGKGWQPGSVRNVGYNVGFLSGSWHTAAVYGWAPYPSVEWYITEMGSNSGTYIGTVNSDGGTYTVYQGTQGGGPQYKEDRQVDQPTAANRSVTMANHVNYWKARGWSFGSIPQTVFMVEAFSGPGSCNATVW